MPDDLSVDIRPSLAPRREALENWLRDRTGDPKLNLLSTTLLPGGAIQRNWRLRLETKRSLGDVVLRVGPDLPLAESRSKSYEFALLRHAEAHGVSVCAPLWLEESREVIGQPFLVSAWQQGIADRAALFAAAPSEGLVADLGAALAEIHTMPLPADVARETPAERVAVLESWARAEVPEGLRHGLEWLRNRTPAPGRATMVHRDFRTGNFLIDRGRLEAVLDWEFAGVGDPVEDIGWFLARCWRGPNTELEAGGLGPREIFLSAYAEAGGAVPDPGRVFFWEVFAHVRWGLIAMEQGVRARAGEWPRHELEEAEARVPGLAADIASMLA